MFAGIIFAVLTSRSTDLNVYAAASLREGFEAIARRFEAAHPGTRVHLEFAGSQDLAAQIGQGAPADVFASAAPKDLDKVAYDPNSRRIVALNALVVVVPARGPLYADFHDLVRYRTLVLAAPAVPAGGYAREALDAGAKLFGDAWRRDVMAHVASEEVDVRAVLTKVELGEADAGIVYFSDAMAGGRKVRTSRIPQEFQPQITYPIAVLRSSKSPREARLFEDAVLSQAGQAELAKHGFLPAIRR